MIEYRDQAAAKAVEKVVRKASAGTKGAARGKTLNFVAAYFDRVAYDDLAQRTTGDLAAQARAFLEFGATRRRGKPSVRVFNPEPKRDGWHCDHTVVEIVNDNMPFLVDSVTAALNQAGYGVRLVIHPIIPVLRDGKGGLEAIGEDAVKAPGHVRESFMHIELDRQAAAPEMSEIKDCLEAVLADVRAAVDDWMPMRAQVGEIIKFLPYGVPGLANEDLDEVREFLRWVDDDHYTFLGYRRYDFTAPKSKGRDGTVVKGSGLGILRDPKMRVFFTEANAPTGAARRELAASSIITISKANRVSTVHRPVHMDTVGVMITDAKGNTIGEHRFVGLFTSHAYSISPRFIPLLRQRISRVIARAGFDPAGHDGKALLHILETYPRDELFQIGEDDLLEKALGILKLQERQRTALFARDDPLGRFVSCLVYTPKDGFGTPLREKFAAILCEALNGTISAYYTQVGDDPLARVHFIVKTEQGPSAYDRAKIERDLATAARSWADSLRDIVIAAHGEREGLRLFARYRDAFSASYREDFSPSQAVGDIDRIEETYATGRPALNLYRRPGAKDGELRLKIFHPGGPLPLSDALPMLENMGVRVMEEVPHDVVPAGAKPVWVHDFGLIRRVGEEESIRTGAFARVKTLFEDALMRLMAGEIENDGYNQLVLAEALAWREVVLVRAYSKYLRQVRVPFSQDYMIDTFVRNAGFARMLADLFAAKFDPADRDKAESREVTIKVAYEEALEGVQSLDEDRILRRFLNLVLATVRTNYYQPGADGAHKDYVSLKLDSGAVDELPLPRPWHEIFVYSPRMEGIHLRGGPVARGGIRWSDRREDFRTEILGLMKAQMVKNPVIVPVGAKGGFVVKRPPESGEREAVLAEGVACYKTLMRGLLDVTDNRRANRVIAPKHVVRHDGDDPYLVVAADKGTATFSDIANAISAEYGFWLDDAFASGGSVGYDHKKMGITARGAWESVKRHFREIGKDIQKEDFTVVGVGDMAGDVFGNGMLLSKQIRLVAAFNHMHIFLDPDPDPARSFKERKRLFDTPRSTWADFDASVISKGGGVFARSAKSVSLTPEARALIGASQGAMPPDELIRRLLSAEVDLLWFGGIGTFVKASAESDADAGDRANDAVRVDARDLRCKVLGEGANLGITQAGRIEYARAGGRLNTDSVDNSAGVDCSDHEVNIKILLGQLVAAKKLTRPKRDKLLADMTDEVAELVLRDNYLQTEALTVAEAQAADRLVNAQRLIRALERAGRINRAVEGLPDEETLETLAASGSGLTRPELAVLMAHAKLALYDELLRSRLPDDPFLTADLEAYFPTPIREKYGSAIPGHRLKRELIATSVTNQVVNRAGISFANEFAERTGRDAAEIACAFIVARDGFEFRKLWPQIEALDNKVKAEVQTAMLLDIKRLMDGAVQWLLTKGEHPLDIETAAGRIKPGIDALARCLAEVAGEAAREDIAARTESLRAEGVPDSLAGSIANLPYLNGALDILEVAAGEPARVPAAAGVYFGIGTRFGFDWLRAAAARIEAQTTWQRQAVQAFLDDVDTLQFDLVAHVMEAAGGAEAAGAVVDVWADARKHAVARTEQMLADMRAAGTPDLAMMAVALRQLRQLVGRA